MATSYAQSTNRCADLARFQMPGATIEITRAEMVPAGQASGGRGGPGPMLPAHCRVNGIVGNRTGADGKTYGIRFAVALPANWNGNFLQQGGAGLNGTVGEPIGNQAVGDKPALARGFAVASSDTGHQSTGGGFDGSFMQDQQAALDFEFVAIGRLTVLAKQIWHTAAKNTGYEYQFSRFLSREGLMLDEINAMSDYHFAFLQRVSL